MAPGRPPPDTTDQDLRSWIRRHRVYSEALPHREALRGELPSVGYDLTLNASCVGPGPWDPGGPRCVHLFRRLQELAERVVPPAYREAVHLDAFEPTLRLRPETNLTPEVRLVLAIRHDDGHDYFHGVDARETECLHRVEAELQRWGVPHGGGKNEPAAA